MRSGALPRTISNLSGSTCRLLESYALAATAAGVGLLAATPAEAEIVYTPIHRVIRTGKDYKLDLNHDGVVDFTLHDASNTNTETPSWWLSANPARGNGARGFRTVQGAPWASALQSGAKIGGGQYFPGKLMATARTTDVNGSWANIKNRYLGLKFHIGGKIHYGWARLSVSAKVGDITATLTGYAYETVPNKSIIAGKTREVLQPASLGRLAQGSSGRGAWRPRD